jgi:hypothetical protein
MHRTSEMKDRYLTIHEVEPCTDRELDIIEQALGIKLPNDLKQVATFYSGGLLGGISHHELAAAGAAMNIVDETLRLRAAIGLDERYIVLAEPAISIIVLDVLGNPAVIWCDATDAMNINSRTFSNAPDLWGRYSDFFCYLLEQEEQQQA